MWSLRTVSAERLRAPGELSKRFMDEFGDVLYNGYGSTEVAWAAIAGRRTCATPRAPSAAPPAAPSWRSSATTTAR